MEILTGKLFYVHIAKFVVKKIDLAKVLIVATASEAPTCFIQAGTMNSKTWQQNKKYNKERQENEKRSVSAVSYEPS